MDIKDGEIKVADIGNGQVTAAKIKDGEVKAADIANNAVTSAKIADGTITYADASRSFVRIEHRDDCNCGGTGWDPDGTSNVDLIYDDAITANSVASITMSKTSLMCTANIWSDGIIQVLCDRNIAAGTGIKSAIFNK